MNSNRNAQQAISRELAAASIANLNIDPERSILLALRGLSVQYSPEVENALRLGLATSRVKLTITSEATTNSTAFSPDGKYVAAAETNGVVQIWDAQTGKEELRFNTNAYITKIAYTSTGNQLITAGTTPYIKIYDAMTGKEDSRIFAHPGGITIMAMSPDGSFWATASTMIIKIWDVSTREALFTLLGHTNTVSSVAFSRDGTRVASTDYDGNVIIWDTATGENLITFSAGEAECYLRIIFNADGTRLITSDSCGTVRFWDIAGSEARELFHRKVRASGGAVSLDLSPDGTQLAVGENNSFLFWDASTGFDLFALPNDWYAYGADFSPDGKLFAAGGFNTTIKIWDFSLPGEKLALIAHEGNKIGDVAFSPDGTRLVTESILTSDARIWDATTGQKLLTLKEPDICCSTAFSPDGTRLVTGSINGFARIWDATTGELVSLLSRHTAEVVRAIFSADGTRIATGSYDGTVKVWDAINGKELITMNGRYGGWVNDIAFSPDGKLLATSSTDNFANDGIATIWDAATGDQLFVLGDFQSNPAAAWGLAFSPDGKRLAVGYGDNVARVWDISSMKTQKQPLLVLRGHSVLIWRVAYSPDGTRLATASHDGTIKLWNVSPGPDQGKEITTFPGHTAEVSGIAFSPDGKYLASVSWDGTLRVYFLQLEDLIAYAKTRITRTLTTEECQKYLHVDACPAP